VLASRLGVSGPEITIFGDDYPTPDGTCIRDYVHVDDLGAAHVRALERLTPGTGLKLNLGTGRGHSVREVIDMCRRVTGHRSPASRARAGGRSARTRGRRQPRWP